jgi:RNA polymerase sigma-70 factor (ECF subfamily)
MRAMPGHSADGSLVARARAGDPRAADELAVRHVRQVWRAAYAITGRPDLADDAVQDGFERAFGALDQFDLSRPFAPWITRIVVNRALSLVTRVRPTEEFDEERHGAPADVPASDLEVAEALARIAPDRRAVVVMRIVIGFSPQETADALGIAVGTVHSRLHRGLADLRAALEVTVS